MDAEQRIQEQLDRLGLKIEQEFKMRYHNSCMINDWGVVVMNNGDGKFYPQTTMSIFTLEPEDIVWKEFIQPNWSEDLLNWCKGIKDCWIALDNDESEFWIYEYKPIYETGDYWRISTGDCENLIKTFIKNSLKNEIISILQTGRDETVIQIKDGKPYLREVINGEIQEGVRLNGFCSKK